MKGLIRSALVVLSLQTLAFAAANTAWQQARIVEVRTIRNDRTTAGVVNTPIVDEEKVCEIMVHLGTRMVRGSYTLGKTQAAPPAAWIEHAPVRAQLVGGTLFLKAVTGEQYRLRVESNKPGPATDPWTADELEAEKSASGEQEAKPLVGPDEPKSPAKSAPARGSAPAAAPNTATSPKDASPAESAAAAPPDPATGTVSIISTPYLAELYVDGENMGDTPVKLKLVPGKHTFRCEKQGYKPWTKEITLTTGSELTLNATLEER